MTSAANCKPGKYRRGEAKEDEFLEFSAGGEKNIDKVFFTRRK